MRRFPAIIALGVVVLGCSDQTTSTQPNVPAVTADYTNNLDNGNPRILRGVDDFSAAWTDPRTGLRVTAWTYHAGEGCGDTPDGGFVDAQEVLSPVPTDIVAIRYIANMKGRVYIRVRDMNAAGDCFGNQLVATGWGTLKYNDNDEFASGLRGPDAWSFTIQGVLARPDGTPVRLNASLHFTWVVATDTYHSAHFQVVMH